MTTSANSDTPYEVEQVELAPQNVAVQRGTVAPADISAFLGRAFSVVAEAAGSCGAQLTGPPFARYTVGLGSFAIAAGFPVDRPLPQSTGVESDELPGGPALRVLHVGAYEDVAAAYLAGERWLATHHLTHRGDPWECYLDEPEVEHPRTIVYVPFSGGSDRGDHDAD